MPGSRAITSLGRGPFVQNPALAVRQLDASRGAVIGLTGIWARVRPRSIEPTGAAHHRKARVTRPCHRYDPSTRPQYQ